MARAPKHRFSGLAKSGCWERMEGMRVTFHVETQEDGRKRAVDVRDRHGTKFRLKFRGI